MLFRRMYKKGFKANFFMYSGGHSARLSNTFTLLPLCSAGTDTDHPLVFFLVVVCLPLMSGCSPNEQGFKNKKCPPPSYYPTIGCSLISPTDRELMYTQYAYSCINFCLCLNGSGGENDAETKSDCHPYVCGYGW